MPGVQEVVGDMCRFGLRHSDTGGPVRKRSWFATTSPEIARRLQKKCLGNHRHEHVMGKAAKAAGSYTKAFAKQVVLGLTETVKRKEPGRWATWARKAGTTFGILAVDRSQDDELDKGRWSDASDGH